MRHCLALGLMMVVSACGRTGSEKKSESGLSQAELRRERIYVSRCAACHGRAGAGDGSLAKTLNPRPKDLRDPVWQASVSDAALRKIIVEGGAAVGKSAAMPPNADLASNEVELKNVVDTIRQMKRLR